METGMVKIRGRITNVVLMTTNKNEFNYLDGVSQDFLNGMLAHYYEGRDGHYNDIVICSDYDGVNYLLPAHSGPTQNSFRLFLRHSFGIGSKIKVALNPQYPFPAFIFLPLSTDLTRPSSETKVSKNG